MADRVFETVLARELGSPGAARRLLKQWFAAALEPDELDTAVLLVSELVTNAVRHGDGNITLKSRLDEDRLLVEVIDEGGGFERKIRDRSFENVGDCGLEIVDSESSRWGAHEGTTHVWFEIERRGPRLGSDKKPRAD
jgi:anti-sigma regulatory factor (Ser/Thr protein kinase)